MSTCWRVLAVACAAIILGVCNKVTAQGAWQCDWEREDILLVFAAEEDGPLPEPQTVSFHCRDTCAESLVAVVDLPLWLTCERIGNTYRFNVNSTDFTAPNVMFQNIHLESRPCSGPGTPRYSNLYVMYRVSPVTRIRLTDIRVVTSTEDTNYSPQSVPLLHAGDRVMIKGRARDANGAAAAGREVRILDPIGGSRGAFDSCTFFVNTDSAGDFVYPDPVSQPEGVLCETADIYALWFNVDSAAIPLVLGIGNDAGHGIVFSTLYIIG